LVLLVIPSDACRRVNNNPNSRAREAERKTKERDHCSSAKKVPASKQIQTLPMRTAPSGTRNGGKFLGGGGGGASHVGGNVNGNLNTFCTLPSPQRMFLCDVPLFLQKESATTTNGINSDNTVRLMGTVVEIIGTSPIVPSPPSLDTQTNHSVSQTPSIIANDLATHSNTHLIHFVIDDGTGGIGVFTKRRMNHNNSSYSNLGASYGNKLPTTTNQQRGKLPHTSTMPNKLKANHYLQTAKTTNQTFATPATLESILTSPTPPISLGQTVDCIGRIQSGTDAKLGIMGNSSKNSDNGKVSQSQHRIWLAASSVSLVNNPQAVTMRQFELTSAKRLKGSSDDDNNNSGLGSRRVVGNGSGDIPKNRNILGGYLQRKLNPLFHCNNPLRTSSVVFDREKAFNYIKYSKDEGGITSQELGLLAGAVEPCEMFAVNSAVGQLREDCRIYLNQGKWFPM